ncbi:MAG TPA: hypothetical protein VMB80_05775 [Candidatus Acidoferrum sp.]|nr:hypothetical protein [Candidatus Acidoferrum sp.]
MNTPFPRTMFHRLRSLGFLVVLFCFAPALQAAPTVFPGRVQNNVLAGYIAATFCLEAVCVAWLLRPYRHPRFFALWVLGTHLLTFPLLVGAVWLLQPVFQDFTVALAEVLVVLAEGWLVCQICRRAPSPLYLTPPPLAECWYAALIASACSLLAFWLLLVPVSDMFA